MRLATRRRVADPPAHTEQIATDIILIELGWVLAAASAVLWLRKYPGQRIGRRHPGTQPGRPLTVLGLAGLLPAAFGGARLQTRHHWGWWVVPAVYVSLLLIGTVVPILIRHWQLRHSPAQPAGPHSSAPAAPTA